MTFVHISDISKHKKKLFLRELNSLGELTRVKLNVVLMKVLRCNSGTDLAILSLILAKRK